MAQVHIYVDDFIKKQFHEKVGHGNINKTFVDFMKSYINTGYDDTDEKRENLDYKIVISNIENLKPQIEALKTQMESLNKQMDAFESEKVMLETKRRQREIAELQLQKEETEERERQEKFVHDLISDSSKAHFASEVEEFLDRKNKGDIHSGKR